MNKFIIIAVLIGLLILTSPALLSGGLLLLEYVGIS